MSFSCRASTLWWFTEFPDIFVLCIGFGCLDRNCTQPVGDVENHAGVSVRGYLRDRPATSHRRFSQIVSPHGRTLPALSIKEQHGEIFSDSLPIKCDCKWLLLLTRPPPRDLINPFGSNLPEKTADDIQGRHSFL